VGKTQLLDYCDKNQSTHCLVDYGATWCNHVFMTTDPGQVRIRLGDNAKRVDRYISHLKKLTGIDHSRVDAVWSLVELGLAAFEADEARGKKS
jgi:hypothetical protein